MSPLSCPSTVSLATSIHLSPPFPWPSSASLFGTTSLPPLVRDLPASLPYARRSHGLPCFVRSLTAPPSNGRPVRVLATALMLVEPGASLWTGTAIVASLVRLNFDGTSDF